MSRREVRGVVLLSRGLVAGLLSNLSVVVAVVVELDRRVLREAFGLVRICSKREIAVSLMWRIAWDCAVRWG